MSRRSLKMPLLTFRYLRRDEDGKLGTVGLARREMRECALEARKALRAGVGYDAIRAAFWMMLYHLGMSLHPVSSRRTSRLRLRVNGRTVSVRFRLNQSDLFILKEVFFYGIYSFPYLEHLGTVRQVVDLGSNIGVAALHFQTLFADAQLICVEAVGENADILRRNADENGFVWTIENQAIAASTGTVTLYPNEWWSSSSTTGSVARARASGERRLEKIMARPAVRIPSISLPDLLSRHAVGLVDILKIDVEGAEAELFAGDVGWLDDVRLVIMEIHRKYVDETPILEALRRRGFVQVQPRSGPCDVFVRRA